MLDMARSEDGFATRAIHAGQGHDPSTGAVVVPIYQTATFAHEAVDRHKGYSYSRASNPTRTALETCLASLESADAGVAFASGLAACAAILDLLRHGDEVVAVSDLYGGVYRLFEQLYRPRGLIFTYVEAEQLAAADPLSPQTRLLWLETPTNPLLNVLDIAAAAQVAHRHNAQLVVDNTFASPYLQRPLEQGADIVVHSTTKYIGGHSDVIGGVVVTNDNVTAERLRFLQKAAGAVPSPLDCWLILRGAKTLAVRMREHSANARVVAEYLRDHPLVNRVFWPGFEDHPGHETATRQMDDYGGMVSFTLPVPRLAVTFVSRLRLFTLAESLGGVESLVDHPATMTHASMRDTAFAPAAELVRLSVGLEEPADLVADLDQALDSLTGIGSTPSAAAGR
jgi:cystathionine beta-lyase/cystathionine gamma-synthase